MPSMEEMTAPLRKSVRTAVAFSRLYGFEAQELDHRGIDGRYTVSLARGGHQIEVTFIEDPQTHYLRFRQGFVHDDRGGGDRFTSWRATKAQIRALGFLRRPEEAAEVVASAKATLLAALGALPILAAPEAIPEAAPALAWRPACRVAELAMEAMLAMAEGDLTRAREELAQAARDLGNAMVKAAEAAGVPEFFVDPSTS